MPKLVTPYNTAEFYDLVTTARKEFSLIHDDLHTIAVDLRHLLPKASGSKLSAVRVDLKINAHRVARQIEQSAALQLAAARHMTMSYRLYDQLFRGAQPQPRGGFTVN